MHSKSRGVDPRAIRLSKSFLLSDFLGCDSVYRYGMVNSLPEGNTLRYRIEEGECLCDLAEELMAEYGPVSISYGFISPWLSRKIVRWKDPSRPSYHRWDDGAAADFVFHDQVNDDVPPVQIAHGIDKTHGYSRMITYSESPFICLATKNTECALGSYRKAFYENRYVGKGKKPLFVKKSVGKSRSIVPELTHDWKGAGYPTYHGGGILQSQHVRLSNYFMLSDMLFSYRRVCVEGRSVLRGSADKPLYPFSAYVYMAKILDNLVKHIGSRVSVVDGLCLLKTTSLLSVKGPFYRIVVEPPADLRADYLADFLYENLKKGSCHPVPLTKRKVNRLAIFVTPTEGM